MPRNDDDNPHLKNKRIKPGCEPEPKSKSESESKDGSGRGKSKRRRQDQGQDRDRDRDQDRDRRERPRPSPVSEFARELGPDVIDGENLPNATDWPEDLEALELGDYESWLIPGRDEKGGYIRETVGLPPAMDRLLDSVVASHYFPYVTKSDVVRHALLMHMRFLRRVRPQVPKIYLISVLESVRDLVNDDDFRARQEQIYSDIDARIQYYLSRGDTGDAIRLLVGVKSRLNSLPDSGWKRRIMERFERHYKGYLTPTGIITPAEEQEVEVA